MPWYFFLALLLIFTFGFVVFLGAPYVPTKKRLLENAFDKLYPISKKDVLVDIGSGDGVVLRMAAARGAKAIGYELNPILYIISRLLSRHSLVTIRLADYRMIDFPYETTIIYTFGDSRDITKMYLKAKETAKKNKRDIYFMSFGFDVPGLSHIKHDGHFYLYQIKYLQ